MIYAKHAKLTIKVKYDLCELDLVQRNRAEVLIREQLESAARYLRDEGMLSGDGPLILEECSFSVELDG
jgi:hypothetical protein